MQTENPSSEEQKKVIDAHIKVAMTSPNIPKIYSNGFAIATTSADVFIACQLNGEMVSILNLSFTSAKSLANDLKRVIAEIERETTHHIMTISEIKTKTGKK